MNRITTATKIIMLTMAVKDMPKMKDFCTGMLGFEIITEYKQDDAHWWTGIKLPGTDLAISLSTYDDNGTLGVPGLYVLASDIETAHADLTAKGAAVSPITPDLYGPGSNVQWFLITDPDGNGWTIAEAVSSWM